MYLAYFTKINFVVEVHSETLNQQTQILRLQISLPPANEVCEGYVFTGVCLSTGDGSLSTGEASVQTETPPYGKERAVRILLKCILVWT